MAKDKITRQRRTEVRVDQGWQFFKNVRVNEFLDRMARLPLLTVNMEVTSHCNLRCIMCNMKTMRRPRIHMPLDRCRRIVAEAARLGVNQMDFHLAGEPLLHPDIVEIVGIVRQAGIPLIELTTNGTMLDIHRARALIDAGVTRFQVTVDGGNAENFRRIRGGDFDKVVDNLAALIAHLRAVASPVKLQIAAIRFSDIEAEIEAFVAEWRRRTADLSTVAVDIKTFDDLGGNFASDAVAVLERQGEGGPKRRPAAAIADPNALPSPDWVCWQASQWLYVHASGNITPCCYDMDENISLGNIESMSLKDAWTGPALRAMRKAFLDRDFDAMPRMCRTCPVATCPKPG